MPTSKPVCPYCTANAVLCDASAVYGEKFAGRFNIWVCVNYPDCDSYVGVHSNSPYAAPKGSLANATLRKLRIRAHEEFDQLWKAGRMKRSAAYRHLAGIMNIDVKRCHIGDFSEEQCLKALMALAGPRE